VPTNSHESLIPNATTRQLAIRNWQAFNAEYKTANWQYAIEKRLTPNACPSEALAKAGLMQNAKRKTQNTKRSNLFTEQNIPVITYYLTAMTHCNAETRHCYT
jgi:hypothetical protein